LATIDSEWLALLSCQVLKMNTTARKWYALGTGPLPDCTCCWGFETTPATSRLLGGLANDPGLPDPVCHSAADAGAEFWFLAKAQGPPADRVLWRSA